MKLHSAKSIFEEYVEKGLDLMQGVAHCVKSGHMHMYQNEEGNQQFCSSFYLQKVRRSWKGQGKTNEGIMR